MTIRPVFAQQPNAQQPDDEILVTGSFIERPADRPQPITVITNEDLRLEQRGSIAEVFKNLPQNVGSVSTVNTQQGGGSVNMGNSPTTTLNLRGLGARATLVLLNGGRQTTDGGFGFVDINNLAPAIMIERVEILTDGASALYGSDAVAGVANFITRTDFEGIEIRAETQMIADSESDTPDMNFGFIFGSQGERTSIVAGLDYATTEILLVEDRYDDSRLRLGLSSGFGNPSTFAIRNLNGTDRPPSSWTPDPLCGSPLIGGGLAAGELNPAGNQCLLYNALGRASQPESTRINGLSTFRHDLNDNITAQVEVGFARTRYDIPFGFVTPAGITAGTQSFVPFDNPGALATAAAFPSFPHPSNTALATNADISGYTYRGRVFSPAGGPEEQNIHTSWQDTFRVAGRLDGAFGDSGWSWQARFSDSWNDTSFTGTDTIVARLRAALNGYGGPSCTASPATDPGGAQRGQSVCQFWNPFANRLLAQPGDPTYNDPALTQWLTGGRSTSDSGELKTYDFIVTGDLWEMSGGTTGLAVGVHRREQSFSQEWDDLSKGVGNWAFNGAFAVQDFGGSRTTDAAFTELVMYPSDTFEVQLAGRYEEMGDLDSFDPKIGLLWTPADGLFVRASAGTSFRQPGEIQMFGYGSGGASTNPIGGDTINARGLLIGNQNLRPETSENWTLGATWDVTERFTMEVNYWSVTFEDLINQENAQALLVLDRADGFITDPRIVVREGAPREVCEVTGRWFPPASATNLRPDDCMSGFDIELFSTTYVNQDFQETAGLDFTFSYDWEGLGSEWNVRLLGSWTHKYDMTVAAELIDGVGSYNDGTFGSPNPEWRANLVLGWSKGSHMARATMRHTSKLTLRVPTPSNMLTEEKAFNTVDLFYGYALPNGRSDVTVSMVNAFDEDDPLLHGAQTTSTGGLYEMRGRVFRLGLNWGF